MPSDKVPWAKVTVTPEAVEKMSELAAEVERLQRGVDAWQKTAEDYEREVERLREDLRNVTFARADEALKREVKRLRAALQWLVRQVDDVERTSVIREGNIYAEARSALAKEKE
jgi:predicted RNase H-like nuclease (RuvC/YqgF family)